MLLNFDSGFLIGLKSHAIKEADTVSGDRKIYKKKMLSIFGMENRYHYSAFDNEFKSKGEAEIGRFLERERICYLYEYPTAVLDQGKTKIWYPDFTLPEYGMIMEYFGVTGRTDYERQALHKMAVYQDNGIEGVFLKSDCFKGDWPAKILGHIEAILQNRMERFFSRKTVKSM